MPEVTKFSPLGFTRGPHSRGPKLHRDQILAEEVQPGMVIETGGTKRSGWKPRLMDVATVEAHPDHYLIGMVFSDASGKRRIYRWDKDAVRVLGYSEKGHSA